MKKKWLKRILLGCAALFLILLVVLYLSIDGIVRFGVERGATQATGQATSLGSAKLSILGGSVELSGLQIENPAGYSKAKIVAMKGCKASAQISSLFTNDVVIPEVDIDGLEVLVEQNGLKTNLSEVLAVSKSSTPAGGGSSAPTAPGKNIHVHVIKMTGTVVHLNTLGQSLTFDLPAIEMDDPTNPDGRPMKLADLAAKILIEVAQQIANDPHVPAVVRTSINQVGALAGNAGKLLEGGTKDLGGKINKLFGK